MCVYWLQAGFLAIHVIFNLWVLIPNSPMGALVLKGYNYEQT